MQFSRNRIFMTSASLLGALVLGIAGCNGGGSAVGHISLSITDAPVDSANAVVVQVTGVELHRSGSSENKVEDFTFDTPKNIDLLQLQGNASTPLFENEAVPAGNYDWLRLKVNAAQNVIDSYIEPTSGGQYSLWIPSGSETGLKLVSGFTVPTNGTADFTLEFDLRKSVHDPQGNFGDYILKPALRISNNVEVGTLSGTVTAANIAAGCTPVVYLYDGSDVTPDDMDGVDPDPVASAIPQMNASTGDYDYEIGFLLPGNYTASFSCDGAADSPDTNDAMTFSGTQNVSITAKATTTADF